MTALVFLTGDESPEVDIGSAKKGNPIIEKEDIMEREHELTAFEMYILAGSGNPANDLSAHTFPLWACELVLAAPAANFGGYLPEAAICRWAAIEALNCGSHQRASFPMPLPESWRGTGRWLASDHGGWLGLVRDRANAWSDMADRRPWQRLAVLGLVSIWEVKSRRDRAWKLRRGQLASFEVGGRRFEADLADGVVRLADGGNIPLGWAIHPTGPSDDSAAAWDAQPWATFPATAEELEQFSQCEAWGELHRAGVYMAIETHELDKGEDYLVTTGRVSFFRDTPPADDVE